MSRRQMNYSSNSFPSLKTQAVSKNIYSAQLGQELMFLMQELILPQGKDSTYFK